MGIFDQAWKDLKGSAADAISNPLGTLVKLEVTYLTGGLDYIYNALKPQAPPDYNIGTQPILVNIASNIAPINVVYGSRKVGGTRVFADVTGATNEYLHMIIVLCEGEVQAINTIYLDDIPSTDPKFTGFVLYEKFTGSDTQTACASLIAAIPSKWTSAHQGKGIAYLYVQLKYDRTVFPKGLPVITADVDGKKVYNAATLTTEFSHNPIWIVRDYLTSTRYGRGISSSLIDDTGAIAAAAYCNTQVAIPYAQTFNEYNKGSGVSVVNNVLSSVSALGSARGILGADEGKYYWEATIGGSPLTGGVGIATSAANLNAVADADTHCLVYRLDGTLYYNGISVQTFTALAAGVVVGIALDANAHTVTFYRNNVAQGTPQTITSEIWLPLLYIGYSFYGGNIAAKFAAPFSYSIPTGFVQWPQTQRLYTCDGVLNINDTAYNNAKALITSCRGDIKFTGGLYRFVIDKAETPTFTFSEDNITGSWSIGQPGRKDKYNRITAKFYNPYLNWQPDLAIQQSATYTAQDGGRVSEKKVDLPFTTDIYRAQHIIQQDMKKSRFGTVAQFTALPEGLRCESGDVVYVTHTTPGWVNKPFRIASIDLKSDDEVNVVVKEYDPAIYTLDALVVVPTVGISNLPNPFIVAVPGTPVITDQLYQTSGSAGVKSLAVVTCITSPDIYVTNYLLEFKALANTNWNAYPPQTVCRWEIVDLAPGTYQARLRAINSMGVLSSYSATTNKEILGLTLAPNNVTGFTVKPFAGIAICSWDKTIDLDVKIGGYVEIRWCYLTTGATWEQAVVLPEGLLSGDASSANVSLATGTYYIKFKDSTGHYSVTAASFAATEALVTGWTTIATSTQHPTFSGTKVNTVVVSPILKLDSLTLIDSITDLVDSWGYIDTIGGIVGAGTYNFDAPLDLGSVASRRFHARIASYSYIADDLMDSRLTLMDTWSSWDGATINGITALVYSSVSNDNVTYSNWVSFMVADFNCRYAKFKLEITTADPSANIDISELSVAVKI